jgi:D,D-heptose 1,7-bisphosphate phosphatase
MSNKAIFLDRDETLIEDPGYINHPDQVKLLDGVAEALDELNVMGYKLVVVTNQSGVARGIITEGVLNEIHNRLMQLLAEKGVFLDRIYYCPYHPDGVIPKYRKESNWRKPNPGMLLAAAEQMDIDLGQSWCIGNSGRDVEAGVQAGCKTILINNYSHSRQLESNQPNSDYKAVNIREAVNIIKRHHRSFSDVVTKVQPDLLNLIGPPQEVNEPVSQVTEPVSQAAEPPLQVEKSVSQDAEPVSQDVEPVSQAAEPPLHVEKSVSQDAEPVSQDVEPVSQAAEPLSRFEEPVSQITEPVSQVEDLVSQDTESVLQAEQTVFQDIEQLPQSEPAQMQAGFGGQEAPDNETIQLLQAILEQLRKMQRAEMFGKEFSIPRFLSGIVQIGVLFCLLLTILFLLSPARKDNSIMILLGFAAVLQLMALTFYIMQERK